MAALVAKPDGIKPTDFQPLTSLPWLAPHATLESTLDAIYREPDATVRYPVLGRYLWTIPADQLGKAFDLCIAREATDTPNDLIYRFLQIWAARDPQACWKRTQSLFHLVGYDYSWMYYSSWQDRITVQDIDAIRASPFWISADTLIGFPEGIDNSTLSKKERHQLIRTFADRWIDSFGKWPERSREDGGPGQYKFDDDAEIGALSIPLDQLNSMGQFDSTYNSAGLVEIEERRCLQANPGSAPDIIARMKQGPSPATLMLWAKGDLPGMIHWADSQNPAKNDLVLEVREYLMAQVDAATRVRWLANARTFDPKGDCTEDFVGQWAEWDPAGALAAAVTDGRWDVISECARGGVYGAFTTYNTELYGISIVRNFDPSVISPARRLWAIDQWDAIMEEWGDVDIADAARYGVYFLKRMDTPHRSDFLKYCSGSDIQPKPGDMMRRTFNALRVWAVVRPKEMKAWIGALNDPPLQKALTWLLEHPWGGAVTTN